jgi:hypothetical protein
VTLTLDPSQVPIRPRVRPRVRVRVRPRVRVRVRVRPWVRVRVYRRGGSYINLPRKPKKK